MGELEASPVRINAWEETKSCGSISCKFGNNTRYGLGCVGFTNHGLEVLLLRVRRFAHAFSSSRIEQVARQRGSCESVAWTYHIISALTSSAPGRGTRTVDSSRVSSCKTQDILISPSSSLNFLPDVCTTYTPTRLGKDGEGLPPWFVAPLNLGILGFGGR